MHKQGEIQAQGSGRTEALRGAERDGVRRLRHAVVVDQYESIRFQALQRSLEALRCAVVEDDSRPVMPKAERLVRIRVVPCGRPKRRLELEHL
jgi:hypothetical protein